MASFSLSLIIGFGAAAFGMVAYLPQVFRLWKRKTAGDISLPSLLLLITSSASWLVYGFLRGSPPLVVVNGVLVVLQVSLIYLKLRYR